MNQKIKKFSAGLLILLFAFLPWTNGITNSVTPEKITSDLSFYQINTCDIPLFSVIQSNTNTIYQNHYRFNSNEYSSLNCIGTVTGIDENGYKFTISIGFNTLFSVFYNMVLFFLISLFFIPKNKEKLRFTNYKKFISILVATLFFTYGIYGEQRFYGSKIYLIDLLDFQSYLIFIILFFTCALISLNIFELKSDNLINFIPYSFLFVFLFNGTNLYIYSIFFFVLGFIFFLNNKKSRIYIFIYSILVLFWLRNSNEIYYLDPDKIRGLVNTSWSLNSIIYWSFLTIFVILGINYFVKCSFKSFSLENFTKNYIYSGILLFLFGLSGSNIPLINFLSRTIFGQQKGTTLATKLFEIDEWGELVAWRGYFPSAEMMGEFYGIGLLLIFLKFLKLKKVNFIDIIYFSFFLFNLLLSNNRSSLALVFLIIVYWSTKYTNTKFLPKNAPLLLIIFGLLFLFLIELNRNSLTYLSNKIIYSALDFSNEPISSSLEFLTKSNLFSTLVISTLSIFSFLINRSQLWGLFVARYNPSILEFLLGSGPFGLAKLYSEQKITTTITTQGFLLTHSSLILILLFFGVLGIATYLYFWSNLIRNLNRRTFYILYGLNMFVFINLIKSDSILYFSSFLLYVFIVCYSLESIKQNEDISFWK